MAFVLMVYWVYILHSASTGRYYVGSTGNIEERLRRHNANRSAATKDRGPWEVVYREEWPTRPAAVAREHAIKARKSRAYVEALCAGRPVG